MVLTTDSLTAPHPSPKQFDLHIVFSFCVGKYRSSSLAFPSCPPSTVISAHCCLSLPSTTALNSGITVIMEITQAEISKSKVQ